MRKQVNYNDGGAADTREDNTWQENLSDYNSDFSAPSGQTLIIFSAYYFWHVWSYDFMNSILFFNGFVGHMRSKYLYEHLCVDA